MGKRRHKIQEKKLAKEKELEEERRIDRERMKTPPTPPRRRSKPHYLDELLEGIKKSENETDSEGLPSTPVRAVVSSDDDLDTPLAMRLLKTRMKEGRWNSP